MIKLLLLLAPLGLSAAARGAPDEPPRPAAGAAQPAAPPTPAAAAPTATPGEAEKAAAAPPVAATAPGMRPRGLFNFDITMISVGEPVPTKYAATLGLNVNRTLSLEGEYFGGTYDRGIGTFDVSSLREGMALARLRVWPAAKRFNLYAAYGVRWLAADVLGVGATVRSSIIEVGFGHRVDLGPVTLGIDWLSAYVPVGPPKITYDATLAALSASDRQNATAGIDKLSRFPSVALFKIYAGLNF